MVINLVDFRIKLLGTVLIFDALAYGLGISTIIYIRLFLYCLLLLIIPSKKINFINSAAYIGIILAIYIISLSLLNTSNILKSFDSALKIGFSLLIYIYCLLHINNEEKFLKFSKYNLIALCVTLIIIGLSNIFNFGEVNYHDASVLFGASGVNIVKNVFLFGLLSVPYLWFSAKRKSKALGYISFFVGSVLILLATKRSVILILLITIFLLLFYNRKNLRKMIIPFSIALFTGMYFFQEDIARRIENRSERFEISSEDEVTEWRATESLIAIEKFNEGSFLVKIFGNETFNETEAYNIPYMFHNDFAVLLGSTGLLGLFLYILFVGKLGLWIKKYLRKFKFKNGKIYKWMYFSLLIGLIIFGISGNFKSIGSSLSISLAGLGAIQGMIMNRERW